MLYKILEAIGKLIKEKSTRAKFHVDAVQGYGKLPIDVNKDKIDLLTVADIKFMDLRELD